MRLRVDPATGWSTSCPTDAAGHEWRSQGEDAGRLFWSS